MDDAGSFFLWPGSARGLTPKCPVGSNAEARKRSLTPMPNDSKPVVLIADDEPSTVAMLSSHLRSKGYTVLEASDGDQAWELAHEHLPHLVILDVMMPGMSGWEVCRKIREAVSLAHTGVVMLTGIGESLNAISSP